MSIKIAANSFRRYSFVQRNTFSDCYKVSQMPVSLDVTLYSLVKKDQTPSPEWWNERTKSLRIVSRPTYLPNHTASPHKHRNFNTHREKLTIQFSFKLSARRLNFRTKIKKFRSYIIRTWHWLAPLQDTSWLMLYKALLLLWIWKIYIRCVGKMQNFNDKVADMCSIQRASKS
jgi:hypothetical protein